MDERGGEEEDTGFRRSLTYFQRIQSKSYYRILHILRRNTHEQNLSIASGIDTAVNFVGTDGAGTDNMVCRQDR